MAMGIAGGKGKRRPIGEINVTPMVDVMLVLLVIFMITAPVIKQIHGIEVKLPQLPGDAAQTIVTEDPRTLVINADGSVAPEGAKGPEDRYDTTTALIGDLKAYKSDSDHAGKPAVVIIAADRAARWERVMQVWNAVKLAGISQVSFQVEDSNAPATQP